MKYDYLIVGSGLFGATFAQKAKEHNKTALVIDKRDHIAGNVYTKKIKDINIHMYGPHCFHTNKKEIWDYVNQFSKFNNYRHKGLVNYKNQIFSFPINLMTMNQLWGVNTPEEAKEKIKQDRIIHENPQNMEEYCLNFIGKTLYSTFIEGYSSKQWGKHPKELSASIVKRLPVRFAYDDDYFHDSDYQGIPVDGYTVMVENMLDGIKVELGTDFEKVRNWQRYADRLVFCGGIDQYFENVFGKLEYRSLKWENEEHSGDFQGHSCVNYTDKEVPFTRIIEHKHFEKLKIDHTIISKEYPLKNGDPYYPINDDKNNKIYNKYKELLRKEKNIIISGRLGSYKYLDMDDVIALSLKTFKKEND